MRPSRYTARRLKRTASSAIGTRARSPPSTTSAGCCRTRATSPLHREAVEGQRATRGDRHPSTLTSIGNLGVLLGGKGDYAAAELLLREALEAQRATLGNRHPSTLTSIGNLGSLLQDKGDLAAAESLLREALEGQRETLGNRHPVTLTFINNLARCCTQSGKGRPRRCRDAAARGGGGAWRDARQLAPEHAPFHRQPQHAAE